MPLEDERDYPELNKCPDCETFFASDNCPICGRMVSLIPVTQTEIVFVKCHKCKFEGALSPAYFRRIRRLSAYRSRLAGTGRESEAAYGQDLYLY